MRHNRLSSFSIVLILFSSLIMGIIGYTRGESSPAAPASATPYFNVSPLNATAAVGAAITYKVNVTDVKELYSFGFTLSWGMTILKLESRTLRVPRNTYADGILWNPVFKASETSINEANATGVYRLAYTSTAPAPTFNSTSTDGVAVYLNFRVLSPGGETNIYFLDSELTFKNGTAITHLLRDGYFYMAGKKTIPTANFSVSPATKIANKTTITFDGSTSSDPDAGGSISKYIWTFGHNKPKIPAIESDHPYPNNANIEYTLTHTNAIRMRVFFSNITTATGDYVKVFDKNRAQLDSWSGSFVNLWSKWGVGDSLYIVLQSDASTQGWGFKADHYNFYIQVATSTTTYVYTIPESDYPSTPYGPYPFTIKLSVVDNENSQSKTKSSEIQVLHPRPVADFSFTPYKEHYLYGWAYVFVNTPVNFDASASYDPDPGGGISWYAWDFGDGAKDNKTIPTTSHTYTVGGVMTVGLTIRDVEGLRNYVFERIRVFSMVEFARTYGLTSDNPNFNWIYDFNFDNIIDIEDLLVLGRSYY